MKIPSYFDLKRNQNKNSIILALIPNPIGMPIIEMKIKNKQCRFIVDNRCARIANK